MKEKTKEFLKKYLIGFILGVVSASVVIVYAETYFPSNDVTYDNTESGLVSTDVQGAIDELYTECTKEPTSGEIIIEDAGLEKDPYECRYFFTGDNPNNYITFNNEKAGWRIISVECDGTIKIMRQEYPAAQRWDTSRSNDWARPATLNTYLNETYYNDLTNTAKNQIVAKDFSIGAIMSNNNLATQINDENGTKWNGKVALVTVSEYLRSNSNKSSCGTFDLNNDNYSSCKNTTWMYINNNWWTLSPYADNSNSSHFVRVDSYVSNLYANNANLLVFPVVYLSSNIKIIGGTGTPSDPYEISL